MGLAATKVGLKLDDSISSVTGQTLHCSDQKPIQGFSQVGTAEEFDGITVLVGAFTEVYLPNVRGELGLLEAATRYVLVGG